MTILLLPLAILAGFSMYLHFFDKYINVLDFPDLLRTGLYVSNSEREALIDKRLMKLNKKGFEGLTPIKNVIRSFNVKGTDITLFKEINDTDKAYNVEFDRRYKYFIYKDEEDIDNKLHQIIDDYEHMDITPVLAKDNKDYILISDEKYKMIMINKSRK